MKGFCKQNLITMEYLAVFSDFSYESFETLEDAVNVKPLCIIQEDYEVEAIDRHRNSNYTFKVFNRKGKDKGVKIGQWKVLKISTAIDNFYNRQVVSAKYICPLGESKWKSGLGTGTSGAINAIRYLSELSNYENWQIVGLNEEKQKLKDEIKKKKKLIAFLGKIIKYHTKMEPPKEVYPPYYRKKWFKKIKKTKKTK